MQMLEIPLDRISAELLQSLLEDYASRDGTDYGERELSLAEKVTNLQVQLEQGELLILYDADSEQWDLAPKQLAHQWLDA